MCQRPRRERQNAYDALNSTIRGGMMLVGFKKVVPESRTTSVTVFRLSTLKILTRPDTFCPFVNRNDFSNRRSNWFVFNNRRLPIGSTFSVIEGMV